MIEYLAEGGIALLDVNPGLIIWTLITITAVFLVLKFFAWGPIAKALDERAEKIHDDLDKAESVRKEAEAKYEEYMALLNNHRAEGQDIVTEARKDAEKLKEEILEAARKEAEAIKERGMRDVKLAMDKALEDYHQDIANISVAVAGQILHKEISAGEQSKLIKDSIDKIKGLN